MMLFHDCSLIYGPKQFYRRGKKDSSDINKEYSDEEIEMFVYSSGTIQYAYFPFFDAWDWPPWYYDENKFVNDYYTSDYPFSSREVLDKGRESYREKMREFWPEYEDPVKHGLMKKIVNKVF